MWALLAIQAALAGDGPWTLAPGEHNAFVGIDYYRYANIDAGGQDAALPTGLTAAGLTGVWTFGVRDGVDAELKVPYERVRANDPEAEGCVTDRPADWCKTSAGLGDLGGQLKVRALNELYGPPVTLSVNLGFRSGEAYAARRGRLTTLGDGQTDVGFGLSSGRTDVLGQGWYRAGADLWYWRRFANAVERDHKIPADELSGAFAVLFSVWPSFAVGPAAHGFWRLGGVDVAEADFNDLDVWASLDARQIQLGGKLGVYSPSGGPTVSLTVLRTVLAHNNPSDTLVISAGLGWFLARPDQEAP